MTSPLFKIPLELRIEIYCYLLRSPRIICVRNSIHVRNDPPYDFVSLAVVECRAAEDPIYSQSMGDDAILIKWTILEKSAKKGIEPAILLVNKQTYVEARYLIYSQNRFTFHVAETTWTSVFEDSSRTCSLAERHERQYRASKNAVIIAQRPKKNQVEILSVCGAPSCPEPSSFFEDQPRDFRFMKKMIFGYTMVSCSHRSRADTKREHIFEDTCHYISQHLQLVHLTLIVTIDCLANYASKEYTDRFRQQCLATLPQMSWVQCLVPIVTNLRTLHVSIPNLEPFEEAVMEYLQPKMLQTRKSVQ